MRVFNVRRNQSEPEESGVFVRSDSRDEVEAQYRVNFSEEMGAPSKPARMALGALLIKERLGCSDEEVVEQICENRKACPALLQYFIGLKVYPREAPFDSSMRVPSAGAPVRKRFSMEKVTKINERTVEKLRSLLKSEDQDEEEDFPSSGPTRKESSPLEAESPWKEVLPGNAGKLILEATCAPADMDLSHRPETTQYRSSKNRRNP